MPPTIANLPARDNPTRVGYWIGFSPKADEISAYAVNQVDYCAAYVAMSSKNRVSNSGMAAAHPYKNDDFRL
jgi:hypothetical protein